MHRKIGFLLLILSYGVQQSSGQNLINNGTFNAAAANWTFFAPGITTEAYNSETSYGGTVSTNIVAEIDVEANLRQVNIPVTPGVTYGLSFRHTRRTGNGAAPNPSIFKVKLYDLTSTYIQQDIICNNATWTWQCKNYQFTPTTNSVSIDFENIAATTLGSIVDDITIAPMEQTLGISGLVCQGGSLALHAPNLPNDPNAQYTDYVWSGPGTFTTNGANLTINNAQPATHNGIYTCTMTLNHCLTVTATYHLTITPSTFNRVATICEGDSYDFYGKALFAAGNYDTLIVSGNNLCDSQINLNLTIQSKPKVAALPEGATSACAGDGTLLRLKETSENASYQWYRNDDIINGANGDQYLATRPGVYKIVGILNGCEQASNRITVTINPLPEARILYLPELRCAGDTISLQATSDGTGSLYIWEPTRNFSKIGLADGISVKGIFENPKTKVSLMVIDQNGCSDTDTVTIVTKPCCSIFTANAFTPNGDGLNEMFMPELGVAQHLVQFDIYDRYGKPVFVSNNKTMGWNGNYANGSPANAGTYMYMIRYTCADGKLYLKKGDISLLR